MDKYRPYNFMIHQGESLEPVLVFYTEEGEDREPLNLENSQCELTLKQETSYEPIDVLTFENGRLVLGTVDEEYNFTESNVGNAVKVLFPHKVTSEYVFPECKYELFRICDGNHDLLLNGTITLVEGVSYGTY